MYGKKSIRVDTRIDTRIQQIAEREHTTYTKVVEDALKLYLDFDSMENATVLSQDIQKAFAAQVNIMESRINAKTNRVLSELAIQSAMGNMLIANDLGVPAGTLDKYRQLAVEFLKTNNRVLRLNEIADDA